MVSPKPAEYIIWPPPFDGTTLDWFSLFQDNSLLGLLSLDLLLEGVPLRLGSLSGRLHEGVRVLQVGVGLFKLTHLAQQTSAFRGFRVSDVSAQMNAKKWYSKR